MSNTKKEIIPAETEAQIKETAKDLFFGKGLFGATIQEIADEAGVSRTSINYYFGSRNQLFEVVYAEALQEVNRKYQTIITSELPFREKVEAWLDGELSSAIRYPFLEVYLVTHMQDANRKCKVEGIDLLEIKKILDQDLKEQAELGVIKPISAIQFMLNIASLVSYPVCIRPIMMDSFALSEADYEKILKERKQIILDSLFV